MDDDSWWAQDTSVPPEMAEVLQRGPHVPMNPHRQRLLQAAKTNAGKAQPSTAKAKGKAKGKKHGKTPYILAKEEYMQQRLALKYLR